MILKRSKAWWIRKAEREPGVPISAISPKIVAAVAVRKIADAPRPCLHPEHNPPSHLSLPPGTYEHVCPACKTPLVFHVDGLFL